MNSFVPKRLDSSAYHASSLRRGPLIDGADAIPPVIAADEVATRPSEDGHAERTDGVEHVLPEAARVAERRALVEDAAVDTTAEVLDEVTEDATVDVADAPMQIDADARHVGHSMI